MCIIGDISQRLSVSESQVKLGLGLILMIARDRLTPHTFGRVARTIPNSHQLISNMDASCRDCYLKTSIEMSPALVLHTGFARFGISAQAEKWFLAFFLDYIYINMGSNMEQLLSIMLYGVSLIDPGGNLFH